MIDHDHDHAYASACACAWTYNLSHFLQLDRFREGFWTGSAYSEPVHAPEPDQNRHNVKRRCVNRLNFEICPWTILGTHWVVPRVHEPVQKQWTGSEWPVNRFTRNLFWCVGVATVPLSLSLYRPNRHPGAKAGRWVQLRDVRVVVHRVHGEGCPIVCSTIFRRRHGTLEVSNG